jgi:iron(III) transport system permease protein
VGIMLGRTNRLHLLISLLLYAFFAVVLIWPLVWIVRFGFVTADGHFTWEYLRLIFSDATLVRGLENAATVACLVTLITVVLSLPLAILSVRYEFPGRKVLGGLLLVPLVLPPFVGAIGMRLMLGRYGPLTILMGGGPMGAGGQRLGIDWMGHSRLLWVVIVEVLYLYPVMLLNLQAALANLDPAMEQAAANLGAGRLTIFRRIALPLIRPGLFAGCTLVLIWSFTELGAPLMFDFYTITPVQVFRQVTDVASNPLPYALVVVMLAASVLLYLIGKVLLGTGFNAATTKASTAATTRQLRGIKGWLASAAFGGVFLLAVLPHIGVVLTSLCSTGAWYKTIIPAHFTLGHFQSALTDQLAFPSMVNSLEYAALATVLAVVMGVAVAVISVRSSVPGKQVLDGLSMLPLAVPGLVLAFGYLALSVWLKRVGPAWMRPYVDVQEWPVLVLIVAYAARRLPYVVRAAAAGLQQTPRDLELAGANVGAGRFHVLRRITLPLIAANLVAGALLAFSFSVLEVSDSLILAQRTQYYPITKAIYDLSARLGDGIYVACALGVWAMVLLILTIFAANALLGKRLGAVFRV